jgi:hypothetical protein
MIDVVALAATLVAKVLVPRLTRGAEQIADEVTDRAGETAANAVEHVSQDIWDRVQSLFARDPGGTAVFAEFEAAPEQLKPAVEAMLVKRLAEDQAAARELDELVRTPGAVGRTAVQLIGDTVGYVDAKGANVYGVVGGVVQGVQPPASPEDPRAPRR